MQFVDVSDRSDSPVLQTITLRCNFYLQLNVSFKVNGKERVFT